MTAAPLPPGTTWESLWTQREAVPSVQSIRSEITPSGGDTAYGLSALRDEARDVAATGEGQRNHALNVAWFRMGRIIAGGHLTIGTARAALADAARHAGLPESEIDLVLRDDSTSAVIAGSASPRVPATPLDEAPQVTVLDEPEIAPEVLSEAVRNRFPLLDWHELWAREDTDEWILRPILPARRLVALYSPPKVGKSLLMLELAVGVAQASPVLGETPDRPRRVLYVDFENDPRGDIYERLTAMGQKPADLDNLCYLSYPTLAKLDTFAGACELLAIVAEYECEVVIIDTISRAVGGEENVNDTWLAFYRNTGLALKQAGVTCARLDHSGKDLDKGMRGGSAKYGDVDAVWKLSRVNDETYRLDCTDNRLPISEKTIVMKRETIPHLRHVVQAEGRIAAYDAVVDDMVRQLDSLSAPYDLGRDGMRDLIKDAGLKPGRNDVLSAAIAKRRIARNMTPDVLQGTGEDDS